MFKGTFTNNISILLIPVLFLLAYTIVGNQKGPYFWTPNQDPDYAYLVDSLNIVNSTEPGMFQHPGTTLSMLGAGVILVSYFIQSQLTPAIAPLNQAVLENPELYLTLISAVLMAITAGGLIALGAVAIRVSRDLYLSLLLQTTPLLMALPIMGYEPSRVAPEVLLFSCSQFLVVFLVLYFYRERVERSPWFCIALGLTMGTGMATKVTFLPLLLFLMLLPGIRLKGLAIAAAVVAFIVGTLPVLGKYQRALGWWFKVGTHEGAYGRGDVGILNPLSILGQIAEMIDKSLVFIGLGILLTVLCLAILLLAVYGTGLWKVPIADGASRRLLLLTMLTAIAFWFQIILTIKEHSQLRYLTPMIGLSGFMAFLIVQLGLKMFSQVITTYLEGVNIFEFIGIIALSLCLAIGIQQIYISSEHIMTGAKIRRADLAKIESILHQESQYKDCLLTLATRASTISSALGFAEFWTGYRFRELLAQLYPQSIFYDERKNRFSTHKQRRLPLNVVTKQGKECILFQTNTLREGKTGDLADHPHLKPIFEGEAEALYQIKAP